MFLIVAHALINILVERSEPKVAAVSVIKLALVVAATAILWTPNFMIRESPWLTRFLHPPSMHWVPRAPKEPQLRTPCVPQLSTFTISAKTCRLS